MADDYPVNERVVQLEESTRREYQRVLYKLQRKVPYLKRYLPLNGKCNVHIRRNVD